MPEREQDSGGDGRTSVYLSTWLVLGLAVVIVGGLFGVRMEHQPDTSRDYPPRELVADGENVLLPAPEVSEEYLPCSDCHESEAAQVNASVRELEEEHDTLEFEHGNLWCLHCHDALERDSLHLADGSLVEFEDSWRLCTQCHAKKLPDWRAGVHGKRTGHWRGPKEYRTCVVCHDPHMPPFKAITPKPVPRRPEAILEHVKAPPSDPEAEGASHEDS